MLSFRGAINTKDLYGSVPLQAGGAGDPGAEYLAKVLALPSASWVGGYPLNEGTDAVIVDASGNGRNGVYTGITWGADTSPWGEAVPFFDGLNDYGTIAALVGTFDEDECTILGWAQVFNAGVWSDGITRRAFNIISDTSNELSSRKESGANQLSGQHRAGGVNDTVTKSSFSATDWYAFALRISATGSYTKFYINGTEVTPAAGHTNAYAGNGTFYLGARQSTPQNPWHGYLAHVWVSNSVMSEADILAFSTA